MPPPESLPRVWSVLYRATTRLAPSDHRRAFGDDQYALFTELFARECPRSAFGRFAWLVMQIVHGIRAALGVRRDHRRRAFGGRSMLRSGGWWGGASFGSDVTFTLRALRRAPWYAAAVVLVIAVTMALATTVFAVVDGVLFRPLPYPDAGQLVSVQPGFLDAPIDLSERSARSTSYPELDTWRRAVPEATFTAFGAARMAETGPAVGPRDDTSGIGRVDAQFFDVIGVRPLFGGFSAEDFTDRSSIFPAVIMYDTWQTWFGGEPDVLGRVHMFIEQRQIGFRVVGVMPRGFPFPSSSTTVDLIGPLGPPSEVALTDPRYRPLSDVVARLPEGMSPAVLRSRLDSTVGRIALAYAEAGGARSGVGDPQTERPYDSVRVASLQATLSAKSGERFRIVAGAVVILLLLGALNVSSFMTARVHQRRVELDVRRSLGAGTWAIVRLWLVESAVLLGAGGIVGVLIAQPLLRIVLNVLPESTALLKAPAIDWRVAGFVGLTFLVLCLVVAIGPAWRSLRTSTLGGGRGAATTRVRTWGGASVIAGQVAAAFVITVLGAGLVGSVLLIYTADRPIRTDGVVVLESRLHGSGGRANELEERIARGLIVQERLRQLPGVTAVGLAEAQVLRGSTLDVFARPQGVPRLQQLDTWGVGGEFFEVIQPVLVSGRLPSRAELDAGTPLIIVSERVAQAYWPGTSAVGQALTDTRRKMPHTVVGVVRDARWASWDSDSPMIYAPYASLSRRSFQTFFVHTRDRPSETLRRAVDAVREADPTIRPRTAATLDELYAASIALRRFQSWLFGSFAAAALAVVGVGILGLLAMSAARRTREVGIRCALGATPGSVVGQLVREQMLAVVAGLAVGAVAAAWALGFIQSWLYQLTPADPRIWLAALGCLLTMAAIGILLPAVRASRVDPLVALREE